MGLGHGALVSWYPDECKRNERLMLRVRLRQLIAGRAPLIVRGQGVRHFHAVLLLGRLTHLGGGDGANNEEAERPDQDDRVDAWADRVAEEARSEAAELLHVLPAWRRRRAGGAGRLGESIGEGR